MQFDDARRRVRAGEDPATVAAEFVADLTLDEKLGCLDGDEDFWPGLIRMAGAANPNVAGSGYSRRPYLAAQLPRTGSPGIAFSDGPRGAVIGPNTCFPVSMARGATFDPDLEERIGEAIGREIRASGATLFGGVNVNLLRHPAWGRAQETYGEDPHHVGEMGAALARGVQRHAMACVKHFALNSIDSARFKVDVQADERALHEVYLPHFKRVIDEGVACVMSAYNSVNGAWCGENHQLLTEILRDEWGFEGFVISDWLFGLRDAVKSVQAGLDIEMPFRQQRMMHVPAALDAGVLSEDDIDRPVTRVMGTLLRFDEVLSQPAPDESAAASAEHRALAYEAAVKSIVLLKNATVADAPLLPLDASKLKRVAVLGRLAAMPNLGDRGSSNVVPPSVITPLDGLRAALPGVELFTSDGADLGTAASLARDADIAIVVVGLTYEDEGEFISAQPELLMNHAPPRPQRPEPAPSEEMPPRREERHRPPPMAAGGDRTTLDLSAADQALIRTAAAANASTIVVMMGGSAIMVEGWHDAVPAIAMLWYPGMEGGRALADVLLGRANATGRLPFVVPTDAAHLPFFDPDATSITYDLFHGQWLLDRDGHAARYPFGHGLSYSSAVIGDASAKAGEGAVTLTATLSNDGPRDATEVVQVYAGVRGSKFERPQRRLAAFRRVDVAAGSSVDIELTFPLDRLAVRQHGAWVVEPGEYEIAVGRHAHDPHARTMVVRVPSK